MLSSTLRIVAGERDLNNLRSDTTINRDLGVKLSDLLKRFFGGQ